MEMFVRKANMSGHHREWFPMTTLSSPERRGVVNEAGFLLFSMIHSEPKEEVARLIKAKIDEAFGLAVEYVYRAAGDEEHLSLTTQERREIGVLAARLWGYFYSSVQRGLQISPPFRGCGILSSCRGDVRIGNEFIYEVKPANPVGQRSRSSPRVGPQEPRSLASLASSG